MGGIASRDQGKVQAKNRVDCNKQTHWEKVFFLAALDETWARLAVLALFELFQLFIEKTL